LHILSGRPAIDTERNWLTAWPPRSLRPKPRPRSQAFAVLSGLKTDAVRSSATPIGAKVQRTAPPGEGLPRVELVASLARRAQVVHSRFAKVVAMPRPPWYRVGSSVCLDHHRTRVLPAVVSGPPARFSVSCCRAGFRASAGNRAAPLSPKNSGS
jgi:hypothetical protein